MPSPTSPARLGAADPRRPRGRHAHEQRAVRPAGCPAEDDLDDSETEERHRDAEGCAGDRVGEPVHLQVGAAPDHQGGRHGGRGEPPAPPRAWPAEEEHERDSGRAGVGGVAGGEGRAMCLEHLPRRALPADGQLDEVDEQWGERLGEGERDQRRPAARDQEHDADPGDRQCAPDAVAERIEDERNVRQEGRFDVLHQLRPATVERERAGGDQERPERHEREQQARPANGPAGPGEELLVGRRPWESPTGWSLLDRHRSASSLRPVRRPRRGVA